MHTNPGFVADNKILRSGSFIYYIACINRNTADIWVTLSDTNSSIVDLQYKQKEC